MYLQFCKLESWYYFLSACQISDCIISLDVFLARGAEKQNTRTGAGLLKLDKATRVRNNSGLREKTCMKRMIKTYQCSAFLGDTIAMFSKILNVYLLI